MRPEASAAMQPYLSEQFANPSGAHRFARLARAAIDDARDRVAAILGVRGGEIVFTGGGTEGDNAAVLGAVRRHRGVAVCPATEHHAVLHCVEHAYTLFGGRVVGVDSTGVVDLDDLAATLRDVAAAGEKVSVVSTMAVNNEVGSITPLRKVARVVHDEAPGALLHTDAVQAACWLDLRDVAVAVDVLTMSAHKFGGPKGVGIMMVRDGVSLEPLLMGGGQERERRSGTHNVAGIVAAAVALEVTVAHRESEAVRLGELARRLVDLIRREIPDVHETVAAAARVPGIVHLCFADVENEALLFLLDEAGVCASAASACASGAMEPSHVLAAMGVDVRLAKGALRLSLGHTTTTDDIDRAAAAITAAVARLRAPRKVVAGR
jgi:cysteine desulfurase